MNVKRMRLVYAAIILVSVAVIAVSGYKFYESLGGFEEVEIYEMQGVQRTVVGKYFKTKAHFEIEDQFVRCRELIANNDIAGDLTVVSILSDSLEENEIEQFVGITLSQDMAEIPEDFEIREYESGKRYVMFLSMHPLVRKPAEKLETMLYAKAQENGEELEDFFIEIYYPDNSMSIEGWVKEVTDEKN